MNEFEKMEILKTNKMVPAIIASPGNGFKTVLVMQNTFNKNKPQEMKEVIRYITDKTGKNMDDELIIRVQDYLLHKKLD